MQTMPMIPMMEMPPSGSSLGAASGAGGEGFGLVLAGQLGQQPTVPQGTALLSAGLRGTLRMPSPGLEGLLQQANAEAVPVEGDQAAVLAELTEALQDLAAEGAIPEGTEAKAQDDGEELTLDLAAELPQPAAPAAETAALAAAATAPPAVANAPQQVAVAAEALPAVALEARGAKPTLVVRDPAAAAMGAEEQTAITDGQAPTKDKAAIDPRFASLLQAADAKDPAHPNRMTPTRTTTEESAPTLRQAQAAPAAETPVEAPAAEARPTVTSHPQTVLAQAERSEIAALHPADHGKAAELHHAAGGSVAAPQDRPVALADITGVMTLPSGRQVAEAVVLDQVVTQMRGSADGESGKMVLRLHPAELGELKIDLAVEGDRLKAQLHAQTQQVQDVIEKHLPRLRDALESQGLRLDQLQVSVSTDQGRGQASQQQHQQHLGWMGRHLPSQAAPAGWNLSADSGMQATTVLHAGGVSLHV